MVLRSEFGIALGNRGTVMREFLKRCAIVAGLMYFAIAAYGAYRLHHRPANAMTPAQEDACYSAALNCWPLPHRAITELTNWGQGRAPGVGACPPGTVEFDIDGLFLECFNGR